MKKANKLKDDARRHELREDWDKAIQAYQRVLELGESEGDVELPLYNRIGDLYVRVGRPTEAVRYYSQAADRYADAGLYNNAIALCNKALRYAPENLDLLRKLGQFSAAQGFLTDARRWFLDYAESAARQGRIEEALQALEDFANSTEDAEIRELFGRTLHQHDQHERAVTELRQAYRLYLGAGDSERAQALAAYLREIAPDISLADEQPMTRSVRGGDDDDYVIRPYAPSGEAVTATAEEGEAAVPSDAAGEAEPGAESHIPDDAHAAASAGDGDSTGAGPLDDYVSTAITDGEHAVVAESDVLEGFQPTSFETEPEDESDAFELPPLETTQATELGPDDVAVALPGLEPTALGGDEEEEPVVELPVLDTDTDDDADVEDTDDVFIELPTLDESEEAVPEANDDRDEEGASFDLPTLAADETTDEERAEREYVVDDIELPTFDTTDPTTTTDADVAQATVESEFEVEADEDADVAAGAEPDIDAQPDPHAEPDTEAESTEAGVAFEQPLLTVDGRATVDTADPVGIRIDRSGEAIDRVITAARGALERGDVAGAAGRLLTLHQELDDPSAYARAAEEVSSLLLEAPGEIRLHQVHVELAERSGEHGLRLSAYLSLAHALEETGALAKAGAIYEHVLEIEPGNADAREALDAIQRKRTPEYVDLKSLLELDQPTGETRFFVSEENPTGDEDSDFAAVLSQFKAKLAEHVAPEDAEAHYDLGLAFKEMGLLDEAIEQFQVALRTGDGRLRVYEELGDCFVQKGEYSVAVKLLERALQLPVEDEMDRVGLYYFLGAASERLGRTDEARDAYERVLGLDVTFRDVAERLSRL